MVLARISTEASAGLSPPASFRWRVLCAKLASTRDGPNSIKRETPSGPSSRASWVSVLRRGQCDARAPEIVEDRLTISQGKRIGGCKFPVSQRLPLGGGTCTLTQAARSKAGERCACRPSRVESLCRKFGCLSNVVVGSDSCLWEVGVSLIN